MQVNAAAEPFQVVAPECLPLGQDADTYAPPPTGQPLLATFGAPGDASPAAAVDVGRVHGLKGMHELDEDALHAAALR